ncbi:hypothetical protein BGZ80_005430 [Entomortierella chlamydospora]|uniref:Uncharacterized protein n=1 Tax=Entomortierella chlamydospora TaxID=101097 RepID=A0A9P6N0H7_9FUNG|nr:hypothetical protein BGZ79_000983 [Entomortierella chlamydospora]KAG0019671.1 hypothetical protein BGZ80_005430 [Entomortierella chlamydospora]
MDRVFRPRWTDPERSLGQLEFIQAEERQTLCRSHIHFERNTRQDIFTAHSALRNALENIRPMSMEDGFATRLNGIVVGSTKNTNLGNAKTQQLRRKILKSLFSSPASAAPTNTSAPTLSQF